MYVPVLKNRMFENKFLRENGNKFFNENIIPLIEMITLKMGRTELKVSDMIAKYDSYFSSSYFLDFFVFLEEKYKPFDPKQVEFSLGIRDESDSNYVDDLLMEVANSKRGIPIIAIKRARSFILNQHKIEMIIKKLQSKCGKIGVRIENVLFEDYYAVIHKLLRASDYLFYDIGESSIDANFFDVQEIKAGKAEYTTIIIHSPRNREYKNGCYKDGGFTELIDNSIRNDYHKYGFDGFADYAGLKNALPTEGGSGYGAALGLFYLNKENKFFSVVNKDTEKGVKGHKHVLDSLFSGGCRKLLDEKKDCPAFHYMSLVLRDKEKTGSWGQWKYITILRYISQIKKSTKTYL